MNRTPSNKAIGIGKGNRTRKYHFQNERVTVEAESLEKAVKLINKKK
jgi:hypothetical protein